MGLSIRPVFYNASYTEFNSCSCCGRNEIHLEKHGFVIFQDMPMCVPCAYPTEKDRFELWYVDSIPSTGFMTQEQYHDYLEAQWERHAESAYERELDRRAFMASLCEPYWAQ
jgi:hypothetical protein